MGSPATWTMLVIVGAVLLSYWPSFTWLGEEWSSTTGPFSHGYLVAGISAFLIFRATQSLGSYSLSPSWVAFPVLLGLTLVWLLGNAADVSAVHTMVLPAIVLASVWAALGRRAALAVSFAVMFFYFAMPAWVHVQFIFQYITTVIVHLFIRIVDIPVYVEGNFVHLPAGSFEIAGGCSGVGFILVGTSLATLYGHLYYGVRQAQLTLVAIALLFAMMINWVRVFAVIVIGNATSMQHPMVADHATFGWFLFAFSMVPLFYFANRLQPDPDETTPSAPIITDVASTTKTIWAATTIVVMVLAAAPIWAHSIRSGYAALTPVRLDLPALSGSWTGPSNTRLEWNPRFIGASAESIGKYRTQGNNVWVYANVYQTQTQNRELIYFMNSAVGDLAEDSRQVRELGSSGSSPGRVVEVEADGARERWVIWYWYEIDGRNATGNAEAKLLQALSFFRGYSTSGAIALATRCAADCTGAAGRLQNFMSAAGSKLQLDNMVSTEQP